MAIRSVIATAAALSLVGALAACGSDQEKADSGPDTNIGDVAKGSPLKVMQILDENEALGVRFEDTRAGGQAGEWAINNRLGGLGTDGHKVELEICNTNQDANQVAACARKAAADPSYIAVIGSYGNSAGAHPILEEAGIPMIGNLYNPQNDGTSEISFPLQNGNPAPPSPAPEGEDFLRDVVGAEKVAIAVVDVVGASQAADFIGAEIEANGMEMVASVPISAASPDISAPVASLIRSGADTVLFVMDSSTTLRTIAEIYKQGATSDLKMVTNGGTIFSQETLEQLGDATENVYIERSFAPIEYVDAPGVEQLKKDLNSADLPIEADDQTVMAYAGFLLLDHVADQIDGEITRESVLEAVKTVKDWNCDGLTANVDFTTPGPDANYPRFSGPATGSFPSMVVDGQIVAAPVGD